MITGTSGSDAGYPGALAGDGRAVLLEAGAGNRNGEGKVSKTRRKHVPLRSCIACREKVPKRELIRVVRSPEGAFEIDPKGKLAGRGAYFCRNRQCWAEALQPGRLSQALKCRVSAEDVEMLKARSWAHIEAVEIESQMVPSGDVVADG
jgi:predicted RNA-binding protein YlxR (DUF448 family)